MLQDITMVEALLGEGVVVVVVVVGILLISLQSFSTSWSKLMTDTACSALTSIMWETSDHLSLSNIKISFRTPSP